MYFLIIFHAEFLNVRSDVHFIEIEIAIASNSIFISNDAFHDINLDLALAEYFYTTPHAFFK